MKLIVLDIDGVLSPGEAHPFDLALLTRLGNLNRHARQDEAIPAVTINTGRPSPYVEAVMQAIDGWQPALYESGAGLYFPQTYQFRAAPGLTSAHLAKLRLIIERLDQAIIQSGRAYWQPGKSVCHTLFAHPPFTLADLTPEVRAIVAEVSDDFIVTPASLALNVHPAGIDKGSGLRWLAQVTGIDPIQMGGVGDSAGDIDFLRLVGQSAAPINATAEVKAIVKYVSSQPEAAGLQEILDYWSLP
ncbi:MAG: HAD hydrolase family protein [Anaerolineales bacterium]|nr:HAD hydrolase family protein [Anaerolineales bacterium]